MAARATKTKRTAGWIQTEDKRSKTSRGGADLDGVGDDEYDGPLLLKAKPDATEPSKDSKGPAAAEEKKPVVQQVQSGQGRMIEISLNDRLGKKIKVKCNSDDTVGDLKKIVAATIGSRPEKLRIQKWYTVFKDHITLDDYEVIDGMSLELYYN